MSSLYYDWEQIVRDLGLRKAKRSGDNIRACCPFHEETNPSFGIHLETGMYNCFSCGEKGGSLQELYFALDVPYTFNVVLEDDPPIIPVRSPWIEFLSHSPCLYDHEDLPYFDYFQSRKIPLETLKEMDVGYIRDRGIVFPIYDLERKFVGWQERRFTGAKYINYPKSMALHNYLYGESRLREKRVIVTEGISDCLRFLSIGENAVATFGNKVSATQAKTILAHTNNVVVAIDNDKYGMNLYNGMKKLLGSAALVWYISPAQVNKEAKDFTDPAISNEDIFSCIEELQ